MTRTDFSVFKRFLKSRAFRVVSTKNPARFGAVFLPNDYKKYYFTNVSHLMKFFKTLKKNDKKSSMIVC